MGRASGQCVAACVGMAAWGAAVAQESARVERPNAAVVYLEAGGALERLVAGKTGREAAELALADEFALDEVWSAALESAALRAALRASEFDVFDTGLDRSQGPNTLLPHVTPMGWCEGVALLDARRAAEDGDHSLAAQRLAAAARMGEHITRDDIVVCSLVGGRYLEHVEGVATRVDWERVDDGARVEWLAALARFDAADPLRLRAAIEGERDVMGAWAERCLASDEGRREMRELLDSLVSVDDVQPKATQGWKIMMEINRVGPGVSVDGWRRSYDDALAVWDGEGAREKLREIGTDVGQGAYGPLAQELTMQFNTPRERADEAVARLGRLRAK